MICAAAAWQFVIAPKHDESLFITTETRACIVVRVQWGLVLILATRNM